MKVKAKTDTSTKGFTRWSPRDIATLRSVYPVKGAKAVAKMIKRTVNAIRKKAWEWQIKKREFINKTQSKIILEMRQAGKSFGQIAQRLNMKKDSVYKHFVRKLKGVCRQLNLFEL